jgi:hypothetical protein
LPGVRERIKKGEGKMSATSQDKEKFEDFESFKEKFRPKLTTDDCYTPQIIMDAVEGWVAAQYGLDADNFCRPFYPGSDYESEDYSGKVVVDNPPFSILSKIINFYVENNIRFFLFAPTLSGLVRYSDVCTALAVGADITYDNGAIVCTSFVTNLEPEGIRMRTPPSLYRAVKRANDENRREAKKQMPKYSYPMNVVSSAAIYPYAKYDIDFVITRIESERITALDSQRESRKSIFGNGLLISDRLKAEREKAEWEKAEREKAEREKAEVWELSERERKIIDGMNRQ